MASTGNSMLNNNIFLRFSWLSLTPLEALVDQPSFTSVCLLKSGKACLLSMALSMSNQPSL